MTKVIVVWRGRRISEPLFGEKRGCPALDRQSPKPASQETDVSSVSLSMSTKYKLEITILLDRSVSSSSLQR